MKTLLVAIACVLSLPINAQVKIGINASTINNAAILELNDTARGLLLPRLTTAQLGLIANPPQGLMVYVTDNTPGVYIQSSNIITSWKQLITPDGQYWLKNTFPASLYYNATPVGIGISSPQSRLHISHNDSNVLRLENTTSLGLNKGNYIDFKTGNYYTGRIATRGTGSFGNAATLGFYTYASSAPSGLIERLTITDGGNVGINNTAPDYSLDLNGTLHTTSSATIGTSLNAATLNTTGGATFGGSVGIGNLSPAYKLDITGNLHTSSSATIGTSLSSNTLNTTGSAAIGGNLSVAGNTVLAGNIQVQGGNPDDGRVLTAIDATGSATWKSQAFGNTERCLVNINGLVNNNTIFNMVSTRYNYSSNIIIDLNTETITFNTPGLYHFEGSFFIAFVTNNSVEVFADAVINGSLLEPLDYKFLPINNINYNASSLQFHHNIYLSAGSTFQLKNPYQIPNPDVWRGFFSANLISN